jgi:hypothetical protein
MTLPEEEIRAKLKERNQVDGKEKKPAEPPYPLIKPDEIRVADVLTVRPPDPEYLIKFKDNGFATRGVVGQIAAAGGTGKTSLIIRLAVACASGKPFAYFSVDNPLNVLILNAEETEEEFNRRLWNSCDGNFPPRRGETNPVVPYSGWVPRGFQFLCGAHGKNQFGTD